MYEGMFPLVSGYLQANACHDSELAGAYAFYHVATSRKTPLSAILDTLMQSDSDVYAFSCYVWNMCLVSSLIVALSDLKPEAQFLLGGPQVMHHADRYLDPTDERTIVCNGEGERKFSGILAELISGRPDLSRVPGLSFFRDQELVTTMTEMRIRNPDDISSPFLTGLFEGGDYRMSVIETNRGCPFRCGFCYWGAANNDKVYKFSESRVRDEITWLSRNNVPVLHIADANWGC